MMRLDKVRQCLIGETLVLNLIEFNGWEHELRIMAKMKGDPCQSSIDMRIGPSPRPGKTLRVQVMCDSKVIADEHA